MTERWRAKHLRKIYGRCEEFSLPEIEKGLSVASSAKKAGKCHLMNEPWLPPGILTTSMDQCADRCCISLQEYVLLCVVDGDKCHQKILMWPML
jgi:hypothetical protein